MSTPLKLEVLGEPSLGRDLRNPDLRRKLWVELPTFSTTPTAVGGRPEQHQGLAVETQGRILSFPYAALLRSLIAEGRITAARALLAVALAQGRNDTALSALRELLAPPRVTRSPAKGVDRSAEFHWLREHWRDYRGQWVAVSGNDLIAQADSLKQLLTALKQADPERRPLIYRVHE